MVLLDREALGVVDGEDEGLEVLVRDALADAARQQGLERARDFRARVGLDRALVVVAARARAAGLGRGRVEAQREGRGRPLEREVLLGDQAAGVGRREHRLDHEVAHLQEGVAVVEALDLAALASVVPDAVEEGHGLAVDLVHVGGHCRTRGIWDAVCFAIATERGLG